MEPEVSGIQAILNNVTTLLTWSIDSMGDITTFLVGNDLGGVYVGMFIIGFAIAALFRILHTA